MYYSLGNISDEQTSERHTEEGREVELVCLSGQEYFITNTIQNCQSTVTIQSNYF